ncbi:MAG: CAP domain-containing protein [candidate division KSB1 bacterium]|nr:CAP domain-containing protein [candidate division KSB1 bacterium]
MLPSTKSCGPLCLVLLTCTCLVAQHSFVVNPQQEETAYPLWVAKGETLSFQISGHWRMWEQWQPVDYRGHTNFGKINEHGYLGTLVGRIEGGDYFAIVDGMHHASPADGRLILFANRGDYRELTVSGALTVTVSGGRPVSAAEAEKLAGWDLSQLDTAAKVPYLSRAEQEVVLYLNKARTNPALFAQRYLFHLRNRSADEQECYAVMLRQKPCSALLPDAALAAAAQAHAEDMGKTGKIGHVGSDGATLRERLWRAGAAINTYLAENCSYGYEDPVQIVLQLLVDAGVPSRGHRRNLLNPNLQFIGVGIRPHIEHRFNSVHDFAGRIKN